MKQTSHSLELGYTLVELLVALAVSSIVIAGTYAGYSFFSQQHQVLTAQTEVDRNALRAIDLFKADVRMAGYLDYNDTNVMSGNQAINIVSSNPGNIIFVYDDYDSSGALYWALIRYYLSPYTPAVAPLEIDCCVNGEGVLILHHFVT
ncbi:PilW family protein [Polynucleobacter necessarius]|uniref:PilW family protein n=1 Tax=Polynucleobacter necessarius TaxID=576610 RepID=UPI000E0949B0|nr:prepilin-type N-terminal cleavage/methylation domain-containing protein [Polynucleobacter necessarius]